MSLVELLEIVSDKTRLRILNLLSVGTLCVCDLVEGLGLGQSNLSKHLRVLREFGLVVGSKKGMYVYYSRSQPTSPDLTALLNALYGVCMSDIELQTDISKLNSYLSQKKDIC